MRRASLISGVTDRVRAVVGRREFLGGAAATVFLLGCGDEEAGGGTPTTTARSTTTPPPTTAAPTTTSAPTTTKPPTTLPAPEITIDEPVDGARFCRQPFFPDVEPGCELIEAATVRVSGTTTPGASVVVSGQQAAVSGSNWVADLRVDEGTTTFEATATTGSGDPATASITLEYREFEPSDW